MKSSSSPAQITFGVVLGVLLQPISLWLVLQYLIATTKAGTEERGWGEMGVILLYVAYFGMAQVLTILPASLLILPTGKHGIVRGLLGLGTFLALANIGILVLWYLTGSQGAFYRL